MFNTLLKLILVCTYIDHKMVNFYTEIQTLAFEEGRSVVEFFEFQNSVIIKMLLSSESLDQRTNI